MPFEAGGVFVRLATIKALIGPDVTVSSHVSVEIGDMPEGLVADAALIGRRRAVRCLVLLQMGLLPEPLMAHQTLERTLP